MQGAEAVWEISKILTFSSVRTPPANTSTVQKYGPSSNGSGQGVTWVQFCPKQLVSISHPTPDLIRPRSNFHLSVINPKSQIAMHMTRKWNRSKKMSSNEPKSMQNPLKHQLWPFQTTFQSTKVIWDPHGGFRPKKWKLKKNQKFGHFLQCGDTHKTNPDFFFTS